jgi:hypothetical protein
MFRAIALIALTALLGCSSPPNDAKLLDEIESRVQLPDGARPLADYARYYSIGPDGKVIGVYLVPMVIDYEASDISCGDATDDFEIKEVPCPQEADPVNGLLAGQRQWIENHEQLPVIDDGGCDVITVIFDQIDRTFSKVFCNGSG